MAVTLQEVAKKAGVSRGTVDRALNNRGRVRPEVAAKIKRIAAEMGYSPNRAGRALAMAKRTIRIGAIVQEVETPFIQELVKGIEKAKDNIEQMGGTVLIKEIRGSDAKMTIQAMEELREEGVYAIALHPLQDNELKEVINRFVDEYHIPVVTLNADIEGTKRLCYVGHDSKACGRTAAGLMREIVQERGEVAIIAGYPGNPGIRERVEGFIEEIKSICPYLQVLVPQYTYNDDERAAEIARDCLAGYPKLRGIYIPSHAEEAVCHILRKEFPTRDIKIITNDLLGESRERLMQEQVRFLLEQDPYIQGAEPILILFRLLFDGEEPVEELQYTDIIIRTKYNLTKKL